MSDCPISKEFGTDRRSGLGIYLVYVWFHGQVLISLYYYYVFYVREGLCVVLHRHYSIIVDHMGIFTALHFVFVICKCGNSKKLPIETAKE